MEPLQTDDPAKVGPYRLLARLGSGGMGVVYLGRSRSGRMVAVKVIRKAVAADPGYRARFRREVAAARQVTGTFIAPLLDADPEAAWLATAYLPGLTLREAVNGFGPMTAEAMGALTAGLAEALVAIHRAGVVHRDLKPANVILTAGGPRVIDFGIARPEGGDAITQAGMPIGTPGFMSPEQVAADQEVGPPSDVFTLGAVLAYAATGAEPFGTGPLLSRQYRVTKGQAELSGIREGWLRALITDCLRREPGQRPTAAGILARLDDERPDGRSLQGTRWLPAQVAEEIDRRTEQTLRPAAGAGEPPAGNDGALFDAVTAEPPAVPSPGRRTIGRRTAIAGTAMGVLAVGALAALTRQREDEQPVRGSVTPPPDPTPTPARTPRAVRTWRVKTGDYYPYLLYAGDVVLVQGEMDEAYAIHPRTGRVLWRRRKIEDTMTSGDIAFLFSAVPPHMTAVRRVSGKKLWTYTTQFGGSFFPARAVITRGVVCVDGHSSGLMGLNVRDGRVLWSSGTSAKNGCAVGTGMMAAAHYGLVGVRARDGRKRWAYPVDEPFAIRHGHGFFLVCDQDHTLHVLRARTGERAWRREEAGYGIRPQTDGTMVYCSTTDGSVLALRAAGGAVVWSRPFGLDARFGGPALDLSGGVLYVSAPDGNLYALDPASGDVLWTYSDDMARRSGVVSAGGLVFVGTRDGYVNALTPPETR